MSPITAVSQVFDAIQQAKTGATAFCTNFFPTQPKLKTWIDHQELLGEARGGSAFFLRKDRDFRHLYFCAASPSVLQTEMTSIPEFKSDALVTDIVGNESSLNDLLSLLESTGFRRYRRLIRLNRPAPSPSPPPEGRAGERRPFVGQASLVDALTKAEHFGAEVVNLKDTNISDEVIALLPRQVARKHRVVPVFKHENTLTVALADPSDLDTIDSLTHLLHMEVNLQVASQADIEAALAKYYGDGTAEEASSRATEHSSPDPRPSTQVILATPADLDSILSLLNHSFDHYADQIPAPYELETSIEQRQIFVIKSDNQVAALLHFETQGVTSTVRFWVVADQFQSRGYGSALIRHYFAAHPTVRRFILWVSADNDNAVQKYRHYGYNPDGLVDHVLINSKILL